MGDWNLYTSNFACLTRIGRSNVPMMADLDWNLFLIVLDQVILRKHGAKVDASAREFYRKAHAGDEHVIEIAARLTRNRCLSCFKSN